MEILEIATTTPIPMAAITTPMTMAVHITLRRVGMARTQLQAGVVVVEEAAAAADAVEVVAPKGDPNASFM